MKPRKVCSQFRQGKTGNGKRVPMLRITGEWLRRELGFNIGDTVLHGIVNGQLVIQKIGAP